MKSSRREQIQAQFPDQKVLLPEDYVKGKRPEGHSPAIIKVKNPKKTGLVNIREYPVEGEGLRVLINPQTGQAGAISLTGARPRIVLDLSKEWDYIRYQFALKHPYCEVRGIIVCEDKLSEAENVVNNMDGFIKAMAIVRGLSKDKLIDFASVMLMNSPVRVNKNSNEDIIRAELYNRLDMKLDINGEFARKVIESSEDEYFEAKVIALKAIEQNVVKLEKGYYKLNGDTLGQHFEDVYEFVKSDNDVFLDMQSRVS